MSDSIESYGPPPMCCFEGASSLSASCWAPGGIGLVGAGNNAAFSLAGPGNNENYSLMAATSGKGNNDNYSLMAASSGRSGNNAIGAENLSMSDITSGKTSGNNGAGTENLSMSDITSGKTAGNNALNLNSLTQETRPVTADTTPPAAPEVRPVAPEVKPAAPEVKPATDAKPAAPEHTSVKDKEQPVVKITDGNKPEEAAKADIVIKANGDVERHGNALQSDKPHTEYRVAVEAGAPEAKVQEVLAELKTGIEAKGSQYHPTLDVPQELNNRVSERAKALYSKDQDSEEEEGKGPPPGGGGGGGGGGPVPKPDGSEEDDKDQGKDKDGRDGADRDGDRRTRAATAADVRNAFATSEYTNMRGGSLGKYSENMNGWCRWCLDCSDAEFADLGDPPDPKKLQALIKKQRAKLSAKMKNMEDQGDSEGAKKLGETFDRIENDDKFAADFCKFLGNQRHGQDATTDEMAKFFTPAMQEAVQSSRVCDTASQMHLDLKNPNGINENQMKDLARNLVAGRVISDQEKAEMPTKSPVAWQRLETYADMVKSKFHTLIADNRGTDTRPRV